MTQEEALRMALEALEADELDMVDDGSGNMVFRKEQAIAAIKKALAHPEQEHVACIAHAMTSAEKAIDVAIKLEREACAKVCDGYSDGRHANMADLCAEAI